MTDPTSNTHTQALRRQLVRALFANKEHGRPEVITDFYPERRRYEYLDLDFQGRHMRILIEDHGEL